MMQNDLEITSKSQFGTQNMQNSTKTLHSDMSGRSAGSWGTVEVWILNIFYGKCFLYIFQIFTDYKSKQHPENIIATVEDV